MTAPTSPHRLVLSIDLDEWYHSRRWLDGQQAREVPDMPAIFRRLYGAERPAGDVVGPTERLLALFAQYQVRCTFFVLGEMARWYPALVRTIAAHGHEIACHGLHHCDMTVVGSRTLAAQLRLARHILFDTTGLLPIGYRAPNLVYAPWATRVLEDEGFTYDSSVCVSRSIGGKYKGWSRAPLHPYRPSYENIARVGQARLIELPLPGFPVLRVAAGSAIITRALGYHWTATALRSALRTGDTGYYLHPWEIAGKPRLASGGLKQQLFYRRTGPWMLAVLDRLLQAHRPRIVTAGEAAARFASRLQPSAPDRQPALGV